MVLSHANGTEEALRTITAKPFSDRFQSVTFLLPLWYFCSQTAFPFSCCFFSSGEILRIRHAFSALPGFSSCSILDKAFNLPTQDFLSRRAPTS